MTFSPSINKTDVSKDKDETGIEEGTISHTTWKETVLKKVLYTLPVKSFGTCL